MAEFIKKNGIRFVRSDGVEYPLDDNWPAIWDEIRCQFDMLKNQSSLMFRMLRIEVGLSRRTKRG
jgi:hypothetical protein